MGYFVEVDLKNQDEIKGKPKFFQFCPEIKVSPQDKISENINEIKSSTYTQTKKLACYWTDKKSCLFRYWMLNFSNRHGMIVDKVLEIISFKES